jgi:4-amino-4-deoxy-L-arabinose transferase-like glycosyltransferase
VYVTWFAVVAGVAARLLWVLLGPRAVVTDAAAYRALAHSLARGAGYATSSGPSAFWVPGWPAWMSLFYAAHAGDLAVGLGNVALGALTVLGTYALTRMAYGASVARVAAVIVALWPSLISLAGLLLSENLALPCVVLVVILFAWASRPAASPWRWLLAGLACGATILVREAGIALVLAGGLLAMRRRTPLPVTSWAAFLIAIVFVLSPWLARNRDVIGRTRLTTSAGANLCIGHGEGATGGYRSLADYALPGTDSSGPRGEVERLDAGMRCAKQGIARHPLRPIALAPAKLSRLLVWDDWAIDDFFGPEMRPRAATWARVACDGAWWLILALAGLGLAARRPWSGGATRAAFFVIVAFAVAVLGTFGTGRFHVLAQPLLAVFAARGVVFARRRVFGIVSGS